MRISKGNATDLLRLFDLGFPACTRNQSRDGKVRENDCIIDSLFGVGPGIWNMVQIWTSQKNRILTSKHYLRSKGLLRSTIHQETRPGSWRRSSTRPPAGGTRRRSMAGLGIAVDSFLQLSRWKMGAWEKSQWNMLEDVEETWMDVCVCVCVFFGQIP